MRNEESDEAYNPMKVAEATVICKHCGKDTDASVIETIEQRMREYVIELEKSGQQGKLTDRLLKIERSLRHPPMTYGDWMKKRTRQP